MLEVQGRPGGLRGWEQRGLGAALGVQTYRGGVPGLTEGCRSLGGGLGMLGVREGGVPGHRQGCSRVVGVPGECKGGLGEGIPGHAGGAGGGPGPPGGTRQPPLTCSPCSLATCLLCSSSALFPMRIFWTPSGAYWGGGGGVRTPPPPPRPRGGGRDPPQTSPHPRPHPRRSPTSRCAGRSARCRCRTPGRCPAGEGGAYTPIDTRTHPLVPQFPLSCAPGWDPPRPVPVPAGNTAW